MSAHLWVSWDDYHRHIEQLARIVHESGYPFDRVLCLARGGLRIGDVFSRVFKTPLHILSTSSYREAAGTLQGELSIAEHITSTDGPLAGRVLLIDDLVDSGVTLERVRAHLGSASRQLLKYAQQSSGARAAPSCGRIITSNTCRTIRGYTSRSRCMTR